MVKKSIENQGQKIVKAGNLWFYGTKILERILIMIFP